MFRHHIREHHEIAAAAMPGAPFPEALVFDECFTTARRPAGAITSPMTKRFSITREIVIITYVEMEMRDRNLMTYIVLPLGERLGGAAYGHMQAEGAECAVQRVDGVPNETVIEFKCAVSCRVIASIEVPIWQERLFKRSARRRTRFNFLSAAGVLTRCASSKPSALRIRAKPAAHSIFTMELSTLWRGTPR